MLMTFRANARLDKYGTERLHIPIMADQNDMTIRKSIRVDRSPEISFKVFCEEIGVWWPQGFSGKGSRLFMETRVGGRFVETRVDGTEYEIGRLTAYQPPKVVAFTWRAPSWDVTTQVEVRFSADGAGTRIELEHSGFDQSPQVREFQKNYSGGWETILGHYQRHCAPSA
jgi:uncharacterized protein YndB with AHSA1/START domain